MAKIRLLLEVHSAIPTNNSAVFTKIVEAHERRKLHCHCGLKAQFAVFVLRHLGTFSCLQCEVMKKVTRILSSLERSDGRSPEELLPLVYDELRKLAAARLKRDPAGQSLQPTALVHDAYVRLVDVDHVETWDSRGHFFAAAAEAMRRILVDRAIKKRRKKHGGDFRRIDLLNDFALTDEPHDQVLTVNEALDRFARIDPDKAALVKLRYFAGLTLEEAAAVLGVSRATASRHWTYAKAWLYRAIKDSE